MYVYVMLKSLSQHHSSNMLPTYVATKHITNKLLFDTYVNNKLLNGVSRILGKRKRERKREQEWKRTPLMLLLITVKLMEYLVVAFRSGTRMLTYSYPWICG